MGLVDGGDGRQTSGKLEWSNGKSSLHFLLSLYYILPRSETRERGLLKADVSQAQTRN